MSQQKINEKAKESRDDLANFEELCDELAAVQEALLTTSKTPVELEEIEKQMKVIETKLSEQSIANEKRLSDMKKKLEAAMKENESLKELNNEQDKIMAEAAKQLERVAQQLKDVAKTLNKK